MTIQAIEQNLLPSLSRSRTGSLRLIFRPSAFSFVMWNLRFLYDSPFITMERLEQPSDYIVRLYWSFSDHLQMGGFIGRNNFDSQEVVRKVYCLRLPHRKVPQILGLSFDHEHP